MSDTRLAEEYKLSVNEDWVRLVEAKVRREIQKDTGLEELLEVEFDRIWEYRRRLREDIFKHPVGMHSLLAKASDCVATHLPVNMRRLIGTVKRQFRSRKVLSDLNPRYIIEQTDALIERLADIRVPTESEYVLEILRGDRVMYDIVFRAYLSSKQILQRHRLTKDMFDFLLVSVEAAFQRARVSYGEMVGIIAAQSLGQPTTQMVRCLCFRCLLLPAACCCLLR